MSRLNMIIHTLSTLRAVPFKSVGGRRNGRFFKGGGAEF